MELAMNPKGLDEVNLNMLIFDFQHVKLMLVSYKCQDYNIILKIFLFILLVLEVTTNYVTIYSKHFYY